MKWLSSILLAGGLVLAGCTETSNPEGKDARIAELESELEREKADSDELEAHVHAILSELGKDPTPAPNDCPSKIDSFVVNPKGDNCSNYTAWVKGWSLVCTATCDQAKRLGEATSDAEDTCKEYCSSKKCSNYTYSAPTACAAGAGGCKPSPRFCGQNCVQYDRCFLEQGNDRINCECSP